MIDYEKQAGSPLFPKVFWNRPINKKAAGSILVIGGHGQQFADTQRLHQLAKSYGAGTVKFLMPDSIKKLIGSTEEGTYLPSTRSGSLSVNGVEEAVASANDCDGVIISSDISGNAETIRFLERFLDDTKAITVSSGEVLKNLLPLREARRSLSAAILSPVQLSEWAKAEKIALFTKQADLQKELAIHRALNDISETTIISYSTQHCITSSKGKVSVTSGFEVDPIEIMASVAIFLIQHPDRFEAATSGVFSISPESESLN